MIAEPVTALTDLLLCVFSLYFALGLRGSGNRGRSLWSWAFLASAAGALTGGTYHAIKPMAAPLLLVILWKITALAIGSAALLMFCGTAISLIQQRARRRLIIAGAILFTAY